jgi:phenylacetate-CoA ligase
MKYFLLRYVAPLLWKYGKGSGRYEIYRFFERQQWRPLEENIGLQQEKIFHLLKYATEHVPYYKKIVAEKNITFTQETVLQDIKKFPILTKEIIRAELKNLQSDEKTDLLINHTGGTTGQPLEFFQDVHYRDYAAANKLLFSKWCGLKDGEATTLLWGSEKDVLERKKGMNDWLFKYFMNNHILNSFDMSQEKMREYCLDIKNHPPKLMIAYVQAIAELSRFSLEKRFRFGKPLNVMTAAGTLYDYQREIIMTAFGGQVFNCYGSREMGDAACECEAHQGLHVNILTHFLEVLDNNLKDVSIENQSGEVYVTVLENYAMPLIRYRIGDEAQYTEKECSCGRGFPLMKNVTGRVMDGLRNRNEKFIPAEFFIHFIGVVFNKGYIDKFQVIQDSLEKITVRIVLNDEAVFQKYRLEIEKSIRKVFETALEIEWKIEKNIENSTSGKFRYIISNLEK